MDLFDKDFRMLETKVLETPQDFLSGDSIRYHNDVDHVVLLMSTSGTFDNEYKEICTFKRVNLKGGKIAWRPTTDP